jgi:xanthine dehydrogenase accessory factor
MVSSIMSETESHRIDPTLADEPAVAMATLVSATGGGSSSKKIGAKMIVGRSGRIVGGVTIGGCVDARVIEAADALVDEGGRRVLSISLDDDEAWEVGLTCGGTVEVVLDRVGPRDEHDPILAANAAVDAALARDEAAVIVTPIEGELAVFVSAEDGTRAGTLGSAALDAAAEAAAVSVMHTESRVETVNGRRYFFDRHAPPMTLVIVGAGQIAMSLSTIARELEMRTIIVDGRERYATRERFPDATEIRVGMPSEIVASITPHARVAAILVAHDYKYELPVLRHLLRTPIGYIGMLGSKTRGAAVRDELRNEGFTDDELARIHSPIGLDLGGKAPPEVALAILAEVIAVRNGKRA